MEDKRIAQMHALYDPDPGRDRAPWKEKEIFSPQDAVVVWQSVNCVINFNPNEDFRFASPTSNYPSHELEILKYEANLFPNRSSKFIMLTGDLSNVDASQAIEEASRISNKNYMLSFKQGDADDLPVEDESLDLLWDRKGRMWHVTGKRDALGVLERYYAYLKPGGVIVLDADLGTPDNGLVLPSTEQRVRDKCGQKFWMNKHLQQLYDMKLVGLGRTKILLLIKK